MQYSKNSKIFIFPLKCVPTNWLEQKEIWVTNPETDLIYFIITKTMKGVKEKAIDPVGILTEGKYYKLMPRDSLPTRTNIKDALDYGLGSSDAREKLKSASNFDSRFSKPKPVANLLKAVKNLNDDNREKKSNSKRFSRDEEQFGTFLGKRAAKPFHNTFLSESGDQNPLANEYKSSAKLLKESVHSTYDKILNDVTLQTSRRANQALGAWPSGSESEKQAKSSHQSLLNFLSKQKVGSQNENKEPLEYLREPSYRPQLSDLAKLGGYTKEPVEDMRMALEDRHFSYEQEMAEQRESTLKKAINTINKAKYKPGSAFYESPKLHEHPGSLPSVFNGGGY